MTGLATSSKFSRNDALRWSICFTVVLLAHGAAALALLNAPEVSDYGVDTPVVMLELPESLVTQAAPPTEMAPGPKEEESEATPPPKEDTKPPEPVAEVALPMPESPKPEPPVVLAISDIVWTATASAVTTGASLVPVMLKVTGLVEEALLLSVTVTV